MEWGEGAQQLYGQMSGFGAPLTPDMGTLDQVEEFAHAEASVASGMPPGMPSMDAVPRRIPAEGTMTTFQQDMIRAISALHQDIFSTRATMRNIELRLTEHGNLLRDYTSSMMSRLEINMDFEGRRATYQKDGICGYAGAQACEFFFRAHKIMKPKYVLGALFSASGDEPVMEQGLMRPAKVASISPAMKCFKRYDGTGCIWVEDKDHAPVANQVGWRHYITLVTTSEATSVDDRVVVDWGIAQFKQLPEDIRLFISIDAFA